MQRITIQAVQGGIQVNTNGQISTTIVEGSFPGCTVSVFNTGTVNLATIFGDNLNPPTAKSNPFTASATGFGFFYAVNGSRVDIQLSGTGIVTPFVVAGDVLVDDNATLTLSAPQIVAFNANPTFDLSVASWFQMTLTGNVTGPVFSNAIAGDLLVMTLIQDGTGGRTFAWPASFLRPPLIASAINATTELTFKFDGTNWRAFAATGDNLEVSGAAAIAGALVVSGASTQASVAVTGNETVGGTLGVTGNETVGGTLIVTGAVTAGSYTNNLSAFAPTTSAQLASIISDETGSGPLVFRQSPVFITPTLGVASATSVLGLTPSFQKFIANGTFTIPTGIVAVKVTLIGGGGAGGGGTVSNNGGGGASGGYAVKYLTGLTPGNTITVTVGAGGTGVSGTTGNSGSASTIASGTQTITTVTANGGGGGLSQGTTSTGGAPAAISTNGDDNGAGVAGVNSASAGLGPPGASTFKGGGGGSVGSSTTGAAAVANTGSGGGGSGSGATTLGGAGAAGIVIFEWVQ